MHTNIQFSSYLAQFFLEWEHFRICLYRNSKQNFNIKYNFSENLQHIRQYRITFYGQTVHRWLFDFSQCTMSKRKAIIILLSCIFIILHNEPTIAQKFECIIMLHLCSGCVVEFHAAAIWGGDNCLESMAVVPVKFWGCLNCKPFVW